jgi:dihydrofolate reductase
VRTSVLVGTSLDGFMARLNGEFDFLPAGGGEPHGYLEFIATVDALVIGRHTFDVVAALPQWPYDRPVFVLSTRPLGIALFGPLSRDVAVRHVATRHYASGLVQSEYALNE